MRQEAMRRWVAVGIFAAGGFFSLAQSPVQSPTSPSVEPAAPAPQAAGAPPQAPAVPAVTGGKLHGTVKSGNIPLPGVTVTAQNTLTGKRYSTTTDITGAWSLIIPQNGRYVIRTQFAAFAAGSQEALLNAASHDQTANFELLLASRAAEQAAREQAREGSGENSQAAQAIRQLAASGAQNLSLVSALASDTEAQAGPATTPAASGAALPSIAGNSDFGGDSVAITGQSGTVSPLAGLDMDRLRDAMETLRAQGGPGGGNFGGGGGLFGGGGPGGGFGGPGGFGGFGGGGGRGNFRGFNPGQPHGAVFWSGSNSALNAEPFSLRGQPQQQPASGTNRFGLSFMSAPYIPGLTKPSGKDTMFLTLSGQRSSTPSDQYATVPTDAERAGNIPGLAEPITSPVPQAVALLKYFPEPNLAGNNAYNYHLLTTQQANNTQAGVRYMRSLGANATQPGGSRGGFGSGGGGRRSQNQGLRQSINFNYNWTRTAQDNVNLFPALGGNSSTDSDSVQAGYTVGYHKLTNIFNLNWNRGDSLTTNFFGGADIATRIGILGPDGAALNSNPINYGLPSVTLSNFTGLNQQQPSSSLSQTISFSETLSWIHAKHNLRFGGDYRRVHRDFLGGSNSTGTFYFTGLYTGSSLGDFLLGEPQETSIDSSASKSYLRDNVMDVYAQDDWRVLPKLTLNYGLRYEYFAPYTEKYGHLAFVDTNPGGRFTKTAEVEAGGSGPYSGPLPSSLIYPFRTAFAPRLGLALRLPRQTVVRAGFGVNYTVGQYATFANTMARQPMVNQPTFVNEQTNEVATLCGAAAATDCLSLANGFPAPDTVGSYALDPHYHLPYVSAWNLDIQKTLPWGVVMNVGYNGSKGNHLDIASAPRASSTSPTTNLTGQVFNYEQAVAFSKFSAGTLRVNKRLTGGIALGANYQYSHSIDDAGSVGGTSTVVAQNWQNLGAEEGNSSFDQRHSVTGTYLYELPFGKDKRWVTSGAGAHVLEGFSVSGSFTFATGTPLTPAYQASVADVARGTAGTLRPNYELPRVSVTAGGGSLNEWFNPAAFSKIPPNPYGNVPRNSIAGPGKVSNSMSLSKTKQLGDTRSMELRATANNVFNTVQYSGVDTTLFSGADSSQASPFGQVNQVGTMRSFQFTARFRF